MADTVIDIFAGAGGMSMGFATRGFKIAAAIEIDEDSASAFNENLGVKPIVADLRDVSPRKLLRAAGLRKGECTVLLGCAPCQSFSAHRRGRKKRSVDYIRNALPFAWVAMVKSVYPRHFCFENVPGMVKAAQGKIFKEFLAELEDLRYRISWSIEDAADFGVPQRRKRLLVVGSRVGQPRLPERTHAAPDSEEVLKGKLLPWRTVRDAIAHLPKLASGTKDPNDEFHAARKQQDIVLERLRHIGEGESHRQLPSRLKLACHRNHDGHPDVYGRMRWDLPSPTLTGGCTNVTKGRFAHPKQDRSITLREAMLLQTFPKKASIRGTRDGMQLQIGNAVPTALARRIANAILAMDRRATKVNASRQTRSK